MDARSLIFVAFAAIVPAVHAWDWRTDWRMRGDIYRTFDFTVRGGIDRASKAFDKAVTDEFRGGQSEQDRIEEAFNRQFPNGKRAGFGGGDAVANTVVAIFDNKSSVGWTSGAHTALPVDTSSYGVNSNVFGGMYENSDIAKKLKAIISVPVK